MGWKWTEGTSRRQGGSFAALALASHLLFETRDVYRISVRSHPILLGDLKQFPTTGTRYGAQLLGFHHLLRGLLLTSRPLVDAASGAVALARSCGGDVTFRGRFKADTTKSVQRRKGVAGN